MDKTYTVYLRKTHCTINVLCVCVDVKLLRFISSNFLILVLIYQNYQMVLLYSIPSFSRKCLLFLKTKKHIGTSELAVYSTTTQRGGRGCRFSFILVHHFFCQVAKTNSCVCTHISLSDKKSDSAKSLLPILHYLHYFI